MAAHKLPIYDLTGQSVGEFTLDATVFDKPANADLLHQVLVTTVNNRRHAIANTKGRGEVSGTNKKPWRQKGTGNARVGSFRSPIWRGGGITFGPTSLRNYANRLPQKMRQAAWRGLLTAKVSNNQIALVNSLQSLDGKTKSWTKAVDALIKVIPGLNRSTLIIDATKADLADRSIRNLANHEYKSVDNVSLYDIARASSVIFTQPAIEALTARLATAKATKQKAAA